MPPHETAPRCFLEVKRVAGGDRSTILLSERFAHPAQACLSTHLAGPARLQGCRTSLCRCLSVHMPYTRFPIRIQFVLFDMQNVTNVPFGNQGGGAHAEQDERIEDDRIGGS
jgi:hypothetical protein